MAQRYSYGPDNKRIWQNTPYNPSQGIAGGEFVAFYGPDGGKLGEYE